MSIDIRLPKIDGQTTEQQMVQVRIYLYQLAEQLNWALSTVSAGSESYVAQGNSGATTSTELSGEGEGNAKANFNQIKSLIIKSADIVNAYYEEINKKLVSEYEAYSDFGDFLEYATHEIAVTSQGVTDYYSDIQTIRSQIKGFEDYVINVQAYTKSGKLEENVYGFEVGQTTEENGVETFNKFARFTADRLSFFDKSGHEVSYVSDKKLFINDVEIKGTLREGGFKDTIMDNGEVITKWVGIGG